MMPKPQNMVCEQRMYLSASSLCGPAVGCLPSVQQSAEQQLAQLMEINESGTHIYSSIFALWLGWCRPAQYPPPQASHDLSGTDCVFALQAIDLCD